MQNGTSKTKIVSISMRRLRGPNKRGRLLTDIFYKPFVSVWRKINTFNYFSHQRENEVQSYYKARMQKVEETFSFFNVK